MTSTILDEAKALVYGERNASYGHPRDNFRMIAEMWNSYLGKRWKGDNIISPRDVAMMMILVKVARDTNVPKRDNLTDIAGYAAAVERLDEPV